MGKKRKIGLLGGTFNPIHNGHLSIARDAVTYAELDQLIFIPNTISPFKLEEMPVSGEQRLEMIRRAIADEPTFDVSDIEIRRGGVSYTIDTVREIQSAYPDAEIFFCLGADSLLDFHKWKMPYALLEAVTVVALARPGFELVVADVKLDAPWPERLLKNLCTVSFVDISSTEVREAAASGNSINSLVPAAVAEYIASCRLYQKKQPENET